MASEKNKTILYGVISKTLEESAEILYNHPVQINHQPENMKNTNIFDVEKTLFQNGMIGETPLQPIKEGKLYTNILNLRTK